MTVRVELQLPEILWRAICMVAEKAGQEPGERAALYLREMLICDAEDGFRDDGLGPVGEEIRQLLKVSGLFK